MRLCVGDVFVFTSSYVSYNDRMLEVHVDGVNIKRAGMRVDIVNNQDCCFRLGLQHSGFLFIV